jgi:hypothetical protein
MSGLRAALVAVALCICASRAGAQNVAPNVTLPQVKMPEGFSVSLYYQWKVDGIRNLVMSGNSRPGGPIIIYGSTWVAGRRGGRTAPGLERMWQAVMGWVVAGWVGGRLVAAPWQLPTPAPHRPPAGS